MLTSGCITPFFLNVLSGQMDTSFQAAGKLAFASTTCMDLSFEHDFVNTFF
jgi:hypothetical protein